MKMAVLFPEKNEKNMYHLPICDYFGGNGEKFKIGNIL